MRWTAVLLASLLLTACGSPRKPIMTRDQAEQDRQELDLRVRDVYDAMQLPFPTQSSHLIEVEILAPPDRAGRILTLPYDEWGMGGPPPPAGSRVTTSPRRWVVGDGSSKGRPLRGWNAGEPERR